MAIGMGDCREKIRGMLIEVCYNVSGCFNSYGSGSNMDIENDTAGWKAAGGTGLIVVLKI